MPNLATPVEQKQKVSITSKKLDGNGALESAIKSNGLLKMVDGEIPKVRKRNGQLVDFDVTKIVDVAFKAMLAADEGTEKDAVQIAERVYLELLKKSSRSKKFIPNVEEIQDLVEKHLILSSGLAKAAKAFILYRKEHAQMREEMKKDLSVSEDVRRVARESSKYFRNSLAELVYYRTYSRWREALGRRETWVETVDRYMDFMKENVGRKMSEYEYKLLRAAILAQEIIPSMRLMWSSGKAARATNVAAYNCSFVSPTNLQDFGEIMYILMCGTGLGFSVESQHVQQLPQIKKQTGKKLKTHVVRDSKESWADAFVLGMRTWFNGKDLDFDYSKVRPRGSRLSTMGGRASGPEPLIELEEFSKKKVFARQGRRLTNIDVHDIVCKIGEIVIAGGVRRSALISLSDLDDNDMRYAKEGQFYNTEPQRSMANNSAVYDDKPATTEFMDEWIALMKSGSGERGIFNRGALLKQLPKRRWAKYEKYIDSGGINPCGEIVLRSKQFCNLTGIVIRPEDNEKSLVRKIRLAAILGTYQATLTMFPYLSKEWKINCEDESLLGVSLTGYWDNEVVRNAKVLTKMREEAVKVNKKYVKRFNINQSTCVTCVKPSGNSSQLLDTASGMHPRYAEYYVRRVRISSTDPLLHMLRDQGVICHPEVGQSPESATTFVLEFPVKSPTGSIMKDTVGAIELLEQWKLLKVNYTEHNPSVTIYVGEDEWVEVANWVYKNWDIIGGISFLPRTKHVYQLAPYEEIDEKTYKELAKRVTDIDFSKLVLYESEDHTKGAKEYACIAGECEV